jgi:hypothetical protein
MGCKEQKDLAVGHLRKVGATEPYRQSGFNLFRDMTRSIWQVTKTHLKNIYIKEIEVTRNEVIINVNTHR